MTIHPNSLANLVPNYRYKSGDEWHGNALGKPKGCKNRTTIYREFLSHKVKLLRNVELTKRLGELSLPDNATMEKLLAINLLTKAVFGKDEIALKAIEMIQDNAYGKQTTSNLNINAQTIEIDTDEMAKKFDELKIKYQKDY